MVSKVFFLLLDDVGSRRRKMFVPPLLALRHLTPFVSEIGRRRQRVVHRNPGVSDLLKCSLHLLPYIFLQKKN